ncbi:MAG TPA: sulfatase-like hydrolase/transferase [Candidatus Acidoferrales bacterium]|nr:sulfatase-like hydrolase/transferase [Candidatus Acidoferrales bacterium]
MCYASRRDALIAVSLANLCYLRVWTELLTYRRWDTYLMKLPPGPPAMLAAMTNVLLLAVLFWGAATLARRSGSKRIWTVAECGFLIFLIVPLNALRAVLSRISDLFKSTLFEVLGIRGVLIAGVSLILAGALGILFFHRRMAAAAATALAMLSPFCAVTFGQAIWKSIQYDAAGFAARPAATLVPGAPERRVVWIVADEWDYRLTFVDRDASLRLPEIDGLRGRTFFADHARPPGPETSISIPAYFTGRPVKGVVYDGPSELQVEFSGTGKLAPWSKEPNVFTRAHDLGFNTAAVEWFHPTCRVLSGLASCEWWQIALQANSMGHSFGELVPDQARSLFETSLLSVFGQSLGVESHIATYRAILRDGIQTANNARYGFTFIHLPIPHAPHGYDRRTGQFELRNSPIRGYVDSLALLDVAVGELRREMIKAGTWDGTTVLITSDHPYREAEVLDGKSDPRIPWILKMAHQREGVVYSRSFNAVLTQDLLLGVLRGELANASDVGRWLDCRN